MKYLIYPILLCLMLFASCSDTQSARQTNPTKREKSYNSVYYWKTVFNPDTADFAFIRRHDISRMYLKIFDVMKDDRGLRTEDKAIPCATLKIDDWEVKELQDSLGNMEFVPVVYITLDALKVMKGNEGLFARNMVTRVKNMSEYNKLPNVREFQLDCDWTVSTENTFFLLCDSVKRHIRDLGLGWKLSSTIRLHQLARMAPPVDKGVLMVYNTGSFNNPDASNSIIDARDVEPYLKHLPDYPLHLDVAYPTYSGQLLFRKRRFIGLLSGMDLSDTLRFTPEEGSRYIARRDIPYRDIIIRKGDMIRQETSDYESVYKVKTMIEKRLSGKPHSNIIYHLDSKNLSKYTSDEINNILKVNH